MTTREMRKIERECTRRLNRQLKKAIRRLAYNRLRAVYAYRLANWETRRLVRAEARRRGYKTTAFAN
jgi:hypothetical protein